MTESEWLACTDPEMMLLFLRGSYRHLSPRKLTLFAATCCGSVLNHSTEEAIYQAVDILDRFAEGRALEAELQVARSQAEAIWVAEFGCDYVSAAVWEATRLAESDPFNAATHAAQVAGSAAACRAGHGTREAECSAQSAWIRDIFPSPYRPKTVRRSWFLWEDGAIVKFARVIYQERRFEDLPILADALEEAGCDNGDILGHLRGPGPHTRGCWPLDLVLGKH